MKAQTVLKKIQAYSKAREIKGYSKSKSAIPYKVRSNQFRSGNLDFSAENMLGHSYDWYEITKQIKGFVVLNTFSYSSSTAKHVGKLHSVLKMLGISYKEIEAPKGLQDLNLSRDHHVMELGYAIVLSQYERKGRYGKFLVKKHTKALEVLKSLGVKHSKASIKEAILDAEKSRIRKNIELKRKRLVKLAESYLENECSFRDYQIVHKSLFGSDSHISSQIAVHQVIDKTSLKGDIDNAIEGFLKDGFSKIVFYI